jgi:crotonobetainyl-CoA:carnitine CoA-transferase CaiB-like acyl-CoA transferase
MVPGFPCHLSATPWSVGRPARLGSAPLETHAARRRPAPGASEGTGESCLPLAGIRALEFGMNWAGPVVGLMLAGLGAEVIRVESRERLDFMRRTHARAFFANANRSKRSVTINLKHPAGRALALRLAAQCDLVFDNFASGVMQRLGLGYDHLRAPKPDLIVLSMAMAGQQGPLSHLRGFATAATGFAGLELALGYEDSGPVGGPFFPLGDLCAAVYGTIALLAALRHRDRTGEGQFIDLSQVEAAGALMTAAILEYQLTGRDAQPNGNRHTYLAPHGIYPTNEDDRWVAVAVRTDAEWQRLRQAMGDPAWARGRELASSAGRVASAAAIDAQFADWTHTLPRGEIVAHLTEINVPAAPVLELHEVLAHPHYTGRELYAKVRTPDGEELTFFRLPWQLNSAPTGTTGRVPALGEANEEILRDRLGLTAAEYEELVAQKAIH